MFSSSSPTSAPRTTTSASPTCPRAPQATCWLAPASSSSTTPATSTPSRSPAAPAAARSPPPTSTPSPRSRRSSRAVLGFGAGSAARALLHFHPDLSVHGWELDPAVLAVARDFFGLAELKKDHAARLSVHVGEPSSRRTTWRRN